MKKFTFLLTLFCALSFSLMAQRGGYHSHHGHHNHHGHNHHGHHNHGHNHHGHHNHHGYHHNHHGHYNHNHRPPRGGYYNGWSPVCTSDFNLGCRSIRGCSFERDRLARARRFASCHHLTVRQIRCIIDMFSFESSRLAFAKYAYSRTCDRNNYYQLYSCFSFSSSCRELDRYIGGF